MITKTVLLPIDLILGDRDRPYAEIEGDRVSFLNIDVQYLTGEIPASRTAFLIACQNILGDALCDVLAKTAGGHTTILKMAIHKAFMEGALLSDIGALKAAQRSLDVNGYFIWSEDAQA